MKKITLLILLLTSCFTFSQVVLTEDFEAGLTVPAGWTIQDLSVPLNGEIWTIETGGEAGGYTSPNTYVYDFGGASGNYATFDSDGYGNTGTAENSTLTSPIFDCSALTSVTLQFNHFYSGAYGGLGEVEAFNGTTWVNILTLSTSLDGSATAEYGLVTIDATGELAGVSNAQIRFRWTGNWSISWSVDNISVFQCTVTAPLAVTTPVPANGATNVEIEYADPNSIGPFSWVESMTGDPADSYTLSLGTDTAGTNIGSIEGATNGLTINYGSWQPNTTYYWFIEAINCAGSTASPVWSFTTAPCNQLAVPAAASTPTPTDGALSVNLNASGNSLSFSWTAGDPGDNFILNLGTSNPPTQSFNNFDNGGTITGLSTNTTYYWSVDAVNCFGTTTGPVWSFTTSNVLSVEDDIADIFSVSPNPVSEILNIKSSQPLNYVSIINLLGQEVVTFNKNELINNSINLSNIKNGLYLIRITAGDKTQTIRIVKE